ncbi:MAG: hypothetical protein ACM3ZE_15790, partial [Myxococcales bacterium]
AASVLLPTTALAPRVLAPPKFVLAAKQAAAREWEERWPCRGGPSGRARLTIVATAIFGVFHLLPIARRSPAATEHDVGGGRRRVAPTGGGSTTRSGEFCAGPR